MQKKVFIDGNECLLEMSDAEIRAAADAGSLQAQKEVKRLDKIDKIKAANTFEEIKSLLLELV